MEIKYSKSFPKILHQLNSTLAISTYQGGRVVFMSSHTGEHIRQFAKRFKRPMGLATDGNRLAIACQSSVEVFSRSKKLATTFPEKPKQFDGMYLPRASYYCGQTDMHDLEWGEEGLWAVNTKFSCLSLITDTSSFIPKWNPPFITELLPEDRCHLNGLALQNGRPKYVSLLGTSDTKEGWRENKLRSGLIMDVTTNEILVEGLPMPHSPRMIGGMLYFLLSAEGEIHRMNTETKEVEKFGSVDGFVRGMDAYQDYLFVATSTIRESSKSFVDLPIAERAQHAGITIFHIPTGKIAGAFTYLMKVKEIFEVKIIPGFKNGMILDPQGEAASRSIFVDEDLSFWKKKKSEEENV